MAGEVGGIPISGDATAAQAAAEVNPETAGAGFAINKILDPGLVSALGPQSGLQVEPVLFQAVETEGRWKPSGLVNTKGTYNSRSRVFELRDHAQQTPPDPPNFEFSEHYGNLLSHTTHLFTLNVPGYSAAALALQMVGLNAAPDNIKNSIGNIIGVDPNQNLHIPCTLSVDANYWSDGLEIFAGWAGMTSATGFYSTFNTTASVALQAIPFGNYFPASVLVTWSGWVNPAGPAYWEFRGAIVLNADGSDSASSRPMAGIPGVQQALQPDDDEPPAFMMYWGRDSNQKPQAVQNYDPDKGFLLSPPDNLSDISSYIDDAATNAWLELLTILQGLGVVFERTFSGMPVVTPGGMPSAGQQP